MSSRTLNACAGWGLKPKQQDNDEEDPACANALLT